MSDFDKRRLIVALCFGTGIWIGFASNLFVVWGLAIVGFVVGLKETIYSPQGWGLAILLFLMGRQFLRRDPPDEPKMPRGRPLGAPRHFDSRP